MQIYAPFLQFRGNCIVRYHKPLLNIQYGRDEEKNAFIGSNLYNISAEETYTGAVSHGVRKRIARAVTLLVQASPERRIFNQVTNKHQKFKLSFITLTISTTQHNLTAKEAHKLLLEPFLLVARRKWGVKSYIWKAELQKRGQIHYHITTNSYIHFQQVRDTWNNLQRKNGLLEEYHQKQGHYNPNSTDIHSVYKIKNIEAYLIKYLSKTEADKGKTEGKVWDCSKNLKQAGYFTVEECSLESGNIQQLIRQGKAEIKSLDFCDLIFVRGGSTLDILGAEGKAKFQQHISAIQV